MAVQVEQVELEFVFLKQLELRETDLRNDNISVLNILSSPTLFLSLSLTLQISQVLMLPNFLFLAFLATFMVTVPMLLHVVPESECLLFVTYSNDQNAKNAYGPPGGEG